jgi:CRISPR-associated protein Cmr4
MSSASALTMFLFAESSIHPGTGSTLSHIDLPIQREVHTQHPIIYASGWKGALRTVFESKWTTEEAKLKTNCIFGEEKGSGAAGQGIFQEVRVALFPVRSLKGTYAWITCPLVIYRLQRDLSAMQTMLSATQAEVEKLLKLEVPEVKDGKGLFCTDSGLLIGDEVAVFEDYEYTQPVDSDAEVQLKLRQTATAFADDLAGWFSRNALPSTPSAYTWWREKMQKDVVVISDEEFTHFVKMHTEVQPHVKIATQGTVESGPWTEEAIPADTVLYTNLTIPGLNATFESLFAPDAPSAAVKKVLDQAFQFQICGDRSLGKGFVRVTCLS